MGIGSGMRDSTYGNRIAGNARRGRTECGRVRPRRRAGTVRRQARLLARLHATVHQAPALPGLRARGGDEDLDSQVLLHGDLHPMNVILTSAGPVIIDWEGAARGAAMYDAAW